MLADLHETYLACIYIRIYTMKYVTNKHRSLRYTNTKMRFHNRNETCATEQNECPIINSTAIRADTWSVNLSDL
jgi:hypothetical protein